MRPISASVRRVPPWRKASGAREEASPLSSYKKMRDAEREE
jgi:hypothetical protein